MLPPGHVAAGFLVASTITHFFGVNLTKEQVNILLAVGAFSGFAPDLDMFYAFYKIGRFIQPVEKVNHRLFITHTPIFWLVLGSVLMLWMGGDFGIATGLVVSFGGLSHLFFDSIQYGVMWLWPFNRTQYALLPVSSSPTAKDGTFMSFWLFFLRAYTKVLRPTFFVELFLLAVSVVVFVLR